MPRESINLLKFGFLLLLSLPFLGSNVLAGQPGESGPGLIAVATNSVDDEAQVSPYITEASHFLLYTNDGGYVGSMDNPADKGGNVEAIARALLKRGVTVVIAQKFNDPALDTFTTYDIIPLDKRGQVRDVVISMLECEPNPPVDAK